MSKETQRKNWMNFGLSSAAAAVALLAASMPSFGGGADISKIDQDWTTILTPSCNVFVQDGSTVRTGVFRRREKIVTIQDGFHIPTLHGELKMRVLFPAEPGRVEITAKSGSDTLMTMRISDRHGNLLAEDVLSGKNFPKNFTLSVHRGELKGWANCELKPRVSPRSWNW
jgi:hypothetical protein